MGCGALAHQKEIIICDAKGTTVGKDVRENVSAVPFTGLSPADVSDKIVVLQDNSKELTAEPQYEGERVATRGDESLVCRTRRGCYLRHQTILKCDHFPSAQSQKLTEKLDDAANFRQVEGCFVFGVGQAGVAGHANVLKRVLATNGVDKVMWLNMREEPIIFINGKPYCVKDRRNPFANQEATGIDTAIVENMEDALVNEILEEAARFGGSILLHGETKPPPGSGLAAFGKPYCFWETVSSDSVITMRSLANRLVSEGFPLKFHRIPITDENSPELKDFDQTLACLSSADSSTGLVFNCQLGRGRTTTGMALAIMLQSWIMKSPSSVQPAPCPDQDDLFMSVTKFVKIVDGAMAGKTAVDSALDRCKHVQHLRDAIVAKRGTKHENVGICYLERYLFLILFMVYVQSKSSGTACKSLPLASEGFEEWVSNLGCKNKIFDTLDHLTLESAMSSTLPGA